MAENGRVNIVFPMRELSITADENLYYVVTYQVGIGLLTHSERQSGNNTVTLIAHGARGNMKILNDRAMLTVCSTEYPEIHEFMLINDAKYKDGALHFNDNHTPQQRYVMDNVDSTVWVHHSDIGSGSEFDIKYADIQPDKSNPQYTLTLYILDENDTLHELVINNVSQAFDRKYNQDGMAEGVFSGVRIKMVNYSVYFNREDLKAKGLTFFL